MAEDYFCFLCSVAIRTTTPESPEPESPENWLHQVRIVYRDGKNAFVTDVGSHKHFNWRAPQRSLLQWNTPSQVSVPVIQQPTITSYFNGFVFHSACWSLLEKAHEPGQLSVGAVLSICESLPIPLVQIKASWGHNFEGLGTLESEDSNRWREGFGMARYEGLLEDPLDISTFLSEIDTIEGAAEAATTSSTPLTLTTNMSGKTTWPSQSTDPFSQLPQEILDMILLHLRTNDALKLFLVYQSFKDLLSNLSFWLSRFEPHKERGYLFEIRESKGDYDVEALRRIFHRSESPIAKSAISNRERVWGLAQHLAAYTRPLSHTSNQTNIDRHGWVLIYYSGKY